MDSIPCTSDSITHSSRSIPVAFEASSEEHRTREMMVRRFYEDFSNEQVGLKSRPLKLVFYVLDVASLFLVRTGYRFSQYFNINGK